MRFRSRAAGPAACPFPVHSPSTRCPPTARCQRTGHVVGGHRHLEGLTHGWHVAARCRPCRPQEREANRRRPMEALVPAPRAVRRVEPARRMTRRGPMPSPAACGAPPIGKAFAPAQSHRSRSRAERAPLIAISVTQWPSPVGTMALRCFAWWETAVVWLEAGLQTRLAWMKGSGQRSIGGRTSSRGGWPRTPGSMSTWRGTSSRLRS